MRRRASLWPLTSFSRTRRKRTTSAKDAIRRIESGDAFDTILCDLMMPEMTGMDVYHRIAKHDPAAARLIVFMTGGAFTPRTKRFLDEIPNERIHKPFHPAALEDLVRRVASGPDATDAR